MSLNTQSGSEASFGPIRSCIWPVHAHEVKKMIPMLLIGFLISYNYSILRNMKDTVVVTASGAEVIPFIKVWVMLPMAVLLTIMFTKLSNRFSQERVFYIMISMFLSFYTLFAFVLYPFRDVLHPNDLADKMELILPLGFKGLISMFRNWTFTGFYVMSELWGSLCLNVLFWGFANEVTKVNEAKRFYGVYGIGLSCAAIVAGQSAIYFSQLPITSLSIFSGREDWEVVQMVLVSVILVSGITTMFLFRWMNRSIFNRPEFDDLHHSVGEEPKKKPKLSFRESFSYLSNSKYLLCIAVLVVGYNLVINLVEVVWKDQLRLLYPDPSDFNTYMNNLTSAIGIFSTVLALFMPKIIGRMGWTKTAMITPVVMLLTCAGFFAFILFGDHLGGAVIALTGTTPLAIAVFFGGAQNCLSKAAKYSVFDATKEMAYIPLSHESKLKGKAAIDGVGSRFGKSGGSLIHQGLLMIFSTITASTAYVSAILFAAIGLWIVAVKSLGRQFSELVPSEGVAEAEKSKSDSTPAAVDNAVRAVS